MNPEILEFLTRIPLIFCGCCGFGFFLLLVGSIGYIVISDLLRPVKPERNAWLSLAEVNGLDFKRGSFSTFGSGAQVVGNYRNHHLKLEVIATAVLGPFSPSSTYTNTRLTLSAKRPADIILPSNNWNTAGKPSTPDDLVDILAPNGLFYDWKGTIKARNFGQEVYYEHYGVEYDQEYLQSLFDLLSDIVDAYPKVMDLGSEIIHLLEPITRKKSQLQALAIQLIRDIGSKTTQQLSQDASRLVCPHCFVRCAVHQSALPRLQTVKYYGCRRCRQSNEFLNLKGQVVAILDTNNPTSYFEQDSQLYVDWFDHREPFDFDAVEVIHATDEEVERFAVRLGNDTDPVRSPRYKQMYCVVSSDCGLSENTIRILRKTFKEVELRSIEENYL